MQDAEAYRKVGMPVARIFTINSKGEIKSEMMDTYRSSYATAMRDACLGRTVPHPALMCAAGGFVLSDPMWMALRYASLNEIVDHMFPPVTAKSATVDISFNDFNFWRAPLPALPALEEVRPQAWLGVRVE